MSSSGQPEPAGSAGNRRKAAYHYMYRSVLINPKVQGRTMSGYLVIYFVFEVYHGDN